MLPTFKTCPSWGSQIGWSIVLWHVDEGLSDGTEAAPDEVDDDNSPLLVVVEPSDEGDAPGGPTVTVVSFPLIVVSIRADDGPAVVDAEVVVASRGTTAPAMMPLVRVKRARRRERLAMAVKERLAW
jgi:hypothetical protein